MKYIFFSLFFLLFGGLVITYFNISKTKPISQKEEKQEEIKPKKEISIVKLLAKTEAKNLFPAKELYLKIDLNYVPKTKILYQTILSKLNKYQIFGIEQILDLNNIRYSIIKSKNDLQLFINFDKKSQAIKIQNLFKNYNFNVKLKKVKIKG